MCEAIMKQFRRRNTDRIFVAVSNYNISLYCNQSNSAQAHCCRWCYAGNRRGRRTANWRNCRRWSCWIDGESWRWPTTHSDQTTARQPPSETWYQHVFLRTLQTASSVDCWNHRSSARRRRTQHLVVCCYTSFIMNKIAIPAYFNVMDFF